MSAVLLLIIVLAVAVLRIRRIRHEQLTSRTVSYFKGDTCPSPDELCCRKSAGFAVKSYKLVDAQLNEGRKWKMSVYRTGDEMSSFISEGLGWKEAKKKLILADLSTFGPKTILLDIGANIGWFSFAAAYLGFQVVAIEPFEKNIQHFRHSLCMAPQEVRDRISLVHTGLSDRDGYSCELWHDAKKNIGSASTICKKEGSKISPNLEQVGKVELRRMDSLLKDGVIKLEKGDKVVMKIGIRGFEPFALEGAKNLIEQLKPKVIHCEFAPEYMVDAGLTMGLTKEEARQLPSKFVNNMETFGYSFERPKSTTDGIHNMVFILNDFQQFAV